MAKNHASCWEVVPSNNKARTRVAHTSHSAPILDKRQTSKDFIGTAAKHQPDSCPLPLEPAITILLSHWIRRVFFCSSSNFRLPSLTQQRRQIPKSFPSGLQVLSPSDAGRVSHRLKRLPLSTSAADCHPWENLLVLTSHGRFHGGLDHANQKLKTLGILSQSWRKRCQCICMTSKILKGHTLSEVCLKSQRKEEIPIT